jgi:CBS domain-containing protein
MAERTKKDGSRAAKGRTVGDVMVREVVTVDSATTLLEAARQMRDANVGMLPVTEDGAVRGIVTDRDLVVRAMARDVRPSETRVNECLSEPPRCAEPDWTLDEAMEEMAQQQVGRLPVVDEGGAVIGVVTLSSLALRSAKRDETLETAQEVSRRSARA